MSQSTDVLDTAEMEVEEMTKDQALQEIGRIAGFRGYSRTQLRKEDMNSVFWYLTGETVAHWKKFQTEKSPSYILLRKAVADECDMEYEDSWSESRAFQRDELREIVRQMRESDDHRQHAQDDE